MNEPQLMNLAMLARRLRRFGLPTAWLKAEAEAGRLPCLRAGQRMLFDSEAVEAALLNRAGKVVRGD
ncbi:MAG: hypothetical protein JXB13_20065 [Phycisphaerae bacterium]|nr:hypothetical protein [Phycisphaerae bacterium]